MFLAKTIGQVEENILNVVRGKKSAVQMALVGLLARGHILIEDIPGVGKTLLAMMLAQSLDLDFRRIQCTSDLLPSDILGVTIFNQTKGDFEFKHGPLFTHILLADEINRATPKTQSALLQAMNEGHVSMDHQSLKLPQPFLVFATQNPIEHQGTYPLPEAQKDRFMIRIRMGYPDRESERLIYSNGYLQQERRVPPILHQAEILELQKNCHEVRLENSVMDYILRLVEATRTHPEIKLGASTRGGLHLVAASKAYGLISGRDYVTPADVKAVATSVLSHRLILKRGYQEGSFASLSDQIMGEILDSVSVPK